MTDQNVHHESTPGRPEDAVEPNLSVNTKHEKIVISWEFLDDEGAPFRRLFVRTFKQRHNVLVADGPPTVSYDCEVMHPEGDFVYSLKHDADVGDSLDRNRSDALYICRWSLDGALFGDEEVVWDDFEEFKFDDYLEVWPATLVDVLDDGRILAIFGAVPSSPTEFGPGLEPRGTDLMFYLGAFSPELRTLDFITHMLGPFY